MQPFPYILNVLYIYICRLSACFVGQYKKVPVPVYSTHHVNVHEQCKFLLFDVSHSLLLANQEALTVYTISSSSS